MLSHPESPLQRRLSLVLPGQAFNPFQLTSRVSRYCTRVFWVEQAPFHRLDLALPRLPTICPDQALN